MGKTINQLTTAASALTSSTEIEIQRTGATTTEKVTLSILKTLLDTLGSGLTPLSNPSLTAVAAGGTQVNLSWTTVSNAVGYNAYISTDNTNFTQIGSTITLTSLSATGLNAGTLYYFRVKALGDNIVYSDSSFGTANATTSVSFNPDALANQFAYVIDEASTVTQSSGLLSQWNDKLASGKDFVCASNKPSYFATGGANNKPYVKVPSGKVLGLTGAELAIANTPTDIFMVVRTPSIVSAQPFPFLGSGGAGDYGLRYQSAKASVMYVDNVPYYIANPTQNSSHVNRTGWMLVRIKFTDNDTCAVEVNGEPVIPFGDGGGSGSSYTMTHLDFSHYPDIEIAEIRQFTTLLGTTDANNLKAYFTSKYALARPTKKIMTFGDSHTVGVQSGTPVGSPYMTRFIANTSYAVSGFSFSGACGALNNTVADFPDVYAAQAVAAYSEYYVLINYGTNDCACASGGYGWSSWATWKANYKTYIQAFITAGFDPAKIIISTPPYSTNGYVNGNLTTVRTLITEIKNELGLAFIDWSQLCIDNSLNANTVSGGDGIHVPDPFHTLMYDALIAITGT